MNKLFEKTFAEFFAGIGLMRIGLERAGWQIKFANDIDVDKWEMYRDNFGDTGEFVSGDVHDLEAGDVPTVGLATASFPCNDLSLAGARQGLAGATEAEGIAEAKGITELNKALAGSGGEVMVKLKLAEALEGKKIVLLPLAGGGMDIKTTNINRILETYGLRSLAHENAGKE